MLFALFGVRIGVSQIKANAGTASRGLSLRQLRDITRACGASASAIRFDPHRAQAYPRPGIVLLRRGHFIVTAKAGADWVEAYYPEKGWVREPIRRLARNANGFGISVSAIDHCALDTKPDKVEDKLYSSFLRLSFNRLGVATIILAIVSQIAILGLPLVTRMSVDELNDSRDASFLATAGVALLLIAATNSTVGWISRFLGRVLAKRVSKATAADIYDRLAAKPQPWFEAQQVSGILDVLNSFDAQLRVFVQLEMGLANTSVALLVGFFALFFVSPWLAVPGFVSLVFSAGIDVAFNQRTLRNQFLYVDALQKRHAFILDVLSQLPMIARFGNLRQARSRYIQHVRKVDEAYFLTNNVADLKSSLSSVLRTIESLAFVSVATIFMAKGEYSLGTFVAVAAYKDLLAQSLSSLFQLYQQYRQLEPHRMQTREMLVNAPAKYEVGRRLVTTGRVSLCDVYYRYGTLDEMVLRGVSFEIKPSDCVVINGPSGSGKSTLAKLICGVIKPDAGHILYDGQELTLPSTGMAAVFQTDRLLTGTIRDNVRLFRRGISDEEVLRALDIVGIKEFVTSLPMRLNTYVGEGLGGLSGGQRQRILLARAVLDKPTLLVLDEATSNLSVEDEHEILTNLLRRGMTLILIAHRPEVQRFANKIYTISKGAVSLKL